MLGKDMQAFPLADAAWPIQLCHSAHNPHKATVRQLLGTKVQDRGQCNLILPTCEPAPVECTSVLGLACPAATHAEPAELSL